MRSLRQASLWLLMVSLPVWAKEAIPPVEWLLTQIHIGEARSQEELIEDSLYRLFKIDPDNPQGLAAMVRLQLKQNKPDEARATAAKLAKAAPGSHASAMANLNLRLLEPDLKKRLQEARLLARAGRSEQALTQYKALFPSGFPTPDLALEYWETLANTPKGSLPALRGLEALVKDYPYGGKYRLALIRQRLSLNPYHLNAYADLESLKSDPYNRQWASRIWFEQLQRMPAEDRAVVLWKRYLKAYPDADPAAFTGLAAQEALLANPAFRAKQRALALLEKESTDYTRIETELQRALQGFPRDADIVGAFGRLKQRQGHQREAQAFYRKALKYEQNIDQRDKWIKLTAEAEIWALLGEADNALTNRKLSDADKKYRAVQRLRPEMPEASAGLGLVSMAHGDKREAERYFHETLKKAPENRTALRGLINLNLTEHPDQTRRLVMRLPAEQRKTYEGELDRLQAAQLRAQADADIARNRWSFAVPKLRSALALQPDNPWLAYDLARARAGAADSAAAESFAPLLVRTPADPVLRYAHALFLSGQERGAQALQSLAQVPRTQWSADMVVLEERLSRTLTLQHARQLYADHQHHEARRYLVQRRGQLGDDPVVALLLGEWAMAAGDAEQARQEFERTQQLQPDPADPEHTEAELNLIELAVQGKAVSEARNRLARFKPGSTTSGQQRSITDPGQQRRIADLWLALGEGLKAEPWILAALQTNRNDPQLWRDAARLAQASRRPQQALADYRQALLASGIVPQPIGPAQATGPAQTTGPALPTPQDFTAALHADTRDDWLKKSIRREYAALYLQQTPTFSVQHEHYESPGTPGISDLQADNLLFETEYPSAEGKAFGRIEQIRLDNGDLGNPLDTGDFGSLVLCESEAPCADSDNHQHATGTSLALGWRSERLNWNVGSTPLGFDVQDIVGGVQTKGDLGEWGWKLNASRRPVTSSLLSYAGTRDPLSGETWGGVRATGLSVGLSFDQGGPYGFWSSLQAHRLTGRNVLDNDRLRAMAGSYLRVIEAPDRLMRVGTTLMLWHFEENLSGYSVGHGGYYSPQQYQSLSFPASYAQRWSNWSLYAEGSGSYSQVRTSDAPYFPTRRDWQLASDNETLAGGSSEGGGYRASLSVENRLSNHWFVGGSMGLERSLGSDYNPREVLIYLRYSVEPWSGELRMPPNPLEAYAEFD